ncbi:3-hexulose-6-phosphate synthase [Salibacterium qingdaonense]|uniref:3-hexulose-6-phosphate synthase n=1 Tax=Salibacterium qingdaonense TaxID=266892 RepID=A0A1I4LDN5_9BACI|nr:3-hexulose-6-phosphate synthase [Salibacterium qingdaonense]SFL88976.1 3-hexulose-6-phosphate synthase [Salibacterium qingdaonense]
MNIQLALDRLNWKDCFSLVEQTSPHIDWIEIGTGVIKEYGMQMVREMKAAYPDKTLVADMKTCDAAASETKQALNAGADITTVMAFSADTAIRAALEEASAADRKVMVDLLGVTDLGRLSQLDTLGVDLISLHIGKDMQRDGGVSGDDFAFIEDYPHWNAAVAGGINADTIPSLTPYEPETLIVGGAVTKADDPEAAAQHIRKLVK